MHILLDQGIFDMRNLGQNALLQAAIQRVKRLWPEASIGVTTFAPNLLMIFFPDVFPVSPDGTYEWHKNRDKYDRVRRFIPSVLLRILLEMREEIWHRWPGLSLGTVRTKIRSWIWRASTRAQEEPADHSPVDAAASTNLQPHDYSSVVTGADLFIATGSQYMCDHARDSAFQVLNRLEAAIRCGIPTAMVGQGMGADG